MSGTEDERIEQVTIKTVRKFEEGVKGRFVLGFLASWLGVSEC